MTVVQQSSEWTEFYMAYALSQGRTPQAQILHDLGEVELQFGRWLIERRMEFLRERGLPEETGIVSRGMKLEFLEWIYERMAANCDRVEVA